MTIIKSDNCLEVGQEVKEEGKKVKSKKKRTLQRDTEKQREDVCCAVLCTLNKQKTSLCPLRLPIFAAA